VYRWRSRRGWVLVTEVPSPVTSTLIPWLSGVQDYAIATVGADGVEFRQEVFGVWTSR